MTSPIYPCLWFNNNGREAAEYYCRIFDRSHIVSDNGMVVIFEVNGQRFMVLNGGDRFTFNEAVSFVVECKDQDEIDRYWNALTAEGSESRCGWLRDKYGVSWQIIPHGLGELFSHPQTAKKAGEALLKMNKIIIADLQ